MLPNYAPCACPPVSMLSTSTCEISWTPEENRCRVSPHIEGVDSLRATLRLHMRLNVLRDIGFETK